MMGHEREASIPRRELLKGMTATAVALGASGGLVPALNRTAEAAVMKSYRFVIVPKVVHPWFDAVVDGAKAQAKLMEEATGSKFVIDYRAPSKADVVLQNTILEQAAATKPDGITLDLLDAAGNRTVLQSIQRLGIPVVAFDSVAPEDLHITSIQNDFAEQARIADDLLIKLLGGKGKVAIMQGFPTAPNHRIRYLAHKANFAKYPGIQVVAEGIDNDSIETAHRQAIAILAAHPDLNGFVDCDAAGPIGVSLAIKEAGLTGKVLHVGLDESPKEILQYIRQGVMQASSATKPLMQGQWAVLALWMRKSGMPLPKSIDTGIWVITKDNVDTYWKT
ncbi:MAG TPA: substrate-binding domain-containing protein [bacterium]|nr:substrate-binding domain-containing protein [bacterium]